MVNNFGSMACAKCTTGGDQGLGGSMQAAVNAHATVGEISDRLRVAWGEHRELITV